jgi:hypothetical protein
MGAKTVIMVTLDYSVFSLYLIQIGIKAISAADTSIRGDRFGNFYSPLKKLKKRVVRGFRVL